MYTMETVNKLSNKAPGSNKVSAGRSTLTKRAIKKKMKNEWPAER